MGYVDVGS